MARTTRLVFLSFSTFFLLLPLAVPKLGMPVGLKADEPAYFLMALSLVEDGDLRCETKDLRRLYDAYPHLPVDNLILMSTDGWNTVFFGKPFLFSALAAPAAALFGARGMVAFNMAMFLTMIWMGYFYLRRHNSEGLAALFSATFFFFSTAFAYVFWLHSETLNMFGIAGCLFFALHRFDEAPLEGDHARRLGAAIFNQKTQALWSGVMLSLAIYNKPMLGAIGLAALYALFNRRGAKAVAAWIAALAVALSVIGGASALLTGKPTPYLGASRVGLKIEDPERLEDVIQSFRTPVDQETNSWTWLARVPEFFPRLLLENTGSFFWGRHTGLLLYMPFAALSFILFVVNDRRSKTKWLLAGSLGAIALFFLLWIDFNWHGGAGFIGNRYYASVYPAFLFLVSVIRPDWIIAAGSFVGGLFLAPILLTPYGAPVPEPTLQAHTRGAAFERFPIEQSLRRQLPGYSTMSTKGITFHGRRDLVRVSADRPGVLWVRGAATAEIWLSSATPLESLVFQLSSLAVENSITLKLADQHQTTKFEPRETNTMEPVEIELKPSGPTRVRYQYDKKVYLYRLLVTTQTGRNPRRPSGSVIQPQFYLGTELTFVHARAKQGDPNG